MASDRPRFRVVLVVGTRPEAIKLAPVVAELERRSRCFEPLVLTTGQHTDMLASALETFAIEPDIVLEFARSGLDDFAAQCGPTLRQVFRVSHPDMVVVQGDTTSALLGAQAAADLDIPVAHVEAGLRSGNRLAPFPEEDNRCAIAELADLHFAPTAGARANLLREGISKWSISVTGNTVVDALRHWRPEGPFESAALAALPLDGRIVLVTAHRRESQAGGVAGICHAIRTLARSHPGLRFVFPVHRSPQVRAVVMAELADVPRVHLVEPVSHGDLLRLLARSWLALTDSGGIQEEAPSFGVPLLITRETTERPEVVSAGAAMLVGTESRRIVDAVEALLASPSVHEAMRATANPFGDGFAAARIVRRMKLFLEARRVERILAPAAGVGGAGLDVPAAFVA